MSLGISRNRLHDMLKSKGKKKQTKKRFSKSSLNQPYDEEEYLKSTLLPSNNNNKTSSLEMSTFDTQPLWIQDYRDCCFILKQVQICREQIKKQQNKKLTALKEDIHQRRIALLSDQATDKLKKCQKKLKSIELSNNIAHDPHQRKMFTNIIVSLAQKIRHLTKQLRLDRQSQLLHEQQLKKYSSSRFDQQIKTLSQSTQQQDWLSQQRFEQLQSNLLEERNSEIMKIVQSIHSLNTIYKQLQDLVIHQGSLLDRIDQNIQTTCVNVKKANEHLKQAQDHQKNSFAKKVIKILIILIFCFFFVLIIKH